MSPVPSVRPTVIVAVEFRFVVRSLSVRLNAPAPSPSPIFAAASTGWNVALWLPISSTASRSTSAAVTSSSASTVELLVAKIASWPAESASVPRLAVFPAVRPATVRFTVFVVSPMVRVPVVLIFPSSASVITNVPESAVPTSTLAAADGTSVMSPVPALRLALRSILVAAMVSAELLVLMPAIPATVPMASESASLMLMLPAPVTCAASESTLVLKVEPPIPVPAFRATAWALTAVPAEPVMLPTACTWSVALLFRVSVPTKSTLPP